MIALALAPRSGRFSHAVGRAWGRALFIMSGCRIHVEGAEHLRPETPRLLVSNHASWLDPAILLTVFPGQLRFVLKRELLMVPFIGWYGKLSGHFLIAREDVR